MRRILLLLLAGMWMLTGLYAFFMPEAFYNGTPGLKQMGPFNIHFIGDVGLAFMASGGVTLWGAWHRLRGLAIGGASWPMLHALFHIQIWSHRGFPFDYIAAFDFAFVITPALIVLILAWRLEAQSG
jgi:hypothetical protein